MEKLFKSIGLERHNGIPNSLSPTQSLATKFTHEIPFSFLFCKMKRVMIPTSRIHHKD